MKRRLFTIASAISLLLLVVVIFLWVRSYSMMDFLDCPASWNSSPKFRFSGIGLASVNCHIELHLNYSRIGPYRGLGPKEIGWSQYPLGSGYRSFPRGKFYFTESRLLFGGNNFNDPDEVTKIYGSPDWFIVLLLMPLPTFWFIRFRRRRQQMQRMVSGLCLKCGYDLRFSKGRCPECGGDIANRPTETAA